MVKLELNHKKLDITTHHCHTLPDETDLVTIPSDGFDKLIAYSRPTPDVEHWDWIHKDFRK